MRFKSTTVLLVIAALVLGGVVLITQRSPKPDTAEIPADGATPLFTFEEDQVQSFSIITPEQVLSFEKNAQGAWQMTKPQQAEANPATIAFLLSRLATGQGQRTITVPTASLADYGFGEAPLAIVDLQLSEPPPQSLVLGGYDFNKSAIYALVNPPEEEGEESTVTLVAPELLQAINRPINDWLMSAEAPVAPSSASPTPAGSPSAPAPTTP